MPRGDETGPPTDGGRGGRARGAFAVGPGGSCICPNGLPVPDSGRRLAVDHCGMDIDRSSSYVYLVDYRGRNERPRERLTGSIT